MPPDTVVLKVDGKPVTAGEIRKLIDSAPPVFFQQFQQDPSIGIAQAFLMRYLGAEADKLKLAEESPWKEQLQFVHAEILTRAMITHEVNSHPVSSEDIDAYYAANRSRYEQARIKIISIAFKAGAPVAGTSPQDLKDAARQALEGAHSQGPRSEADARTLAVDLVKKLRAGADFSEFVSKYSDDKDSKAAGGDFGTVKFNSSYPDEMKRTVFALKPHGVSDPVRIGSAFYIIRLEEKTSQPLSEVREAIILDIRQEHVKQYVGALQKRFTPEILKPEFFLQYQGKAPGKP